MTNSLWTVSISGVRICRSSRLSATTWCSGKPSWKSTLPRRALVTPPSASSRRPPSWDSTYRDRDSSGPGGAIGGGFGLDGAAIGMAVAAVFNALTTTSRVESIIALQTTESEGFFLHQRMTPPELRRYLSPLFVRLRQIRTAHPLPSSVSNSSSSVDMVAQLEKLALLRGAGALTQPEFESAKSRLLAP
jgi:hypothetical protein